MTKRKKLNRLQLETVMLRGPPGNYIYYANAITVVKFSILPIKVLLTVIKC